MDNQVVVYGDTVVVDGYVGNDHMFLEGTIVGISEYCYIVKDDHGKQWDVDISLVKKV